MFLHRFQQLAGTRNAADGFGWYWHWTVRSAAEYRSQGCPSLILACQIQCLVALGCALQGGQAKWDQRLFQSGRQMSTLPSVGRAGIQERDLLFAFSREQSLLFVCLPVLEAKPQHIRFSGPRATVAVVEEHFDRNAVERIKLPIIRAGTLQGRYPQAIRKLAYQLRDMLFKKPFSADTLPLEKIREVHIAKGVGLLE